MRTDFTSRGFEINNHIREFTETKLERLKKQLEDIQDINVVLSVEKYRQKAEIKFLSHRKLFHGSEETNDMYQSIDRVIYKLDAQARKHKDKLTGRKRNSHETIRTAAETPQINPAPAEAAEGQVRLIQTNPASVRPMSVEEAAEQLTKLGGDFLFYRHPSSDVISVVYRRKDGHIGYIQPTAR